MQIDINSSTFNALPDTISSGSDVSGTNYVVSSSYSDSSLVRGTPILATNLNGTRTTTGGQVVPVTNS